ncbi:MAG: HAMP domain-containing protein, partial [Spirochaetaceae bacterium]
MLKNMKMAGKLMVGFGLVIALVGVVGGIAVFNLTAIEGDARQLDEAHVPEVRAANNMERGALNTMFSMRGFQFTFDEAYFDEGQEHLGELRAQLQDADALADRHDFLDVLKSNVADAEEKVSTYEDLAEETHDAGATVEELQVVMEEAAENYMESASAYLDSMNESMEEEIDDGTEAAELEERLQRITFINDVIDIGNEARVSNHKAQASDDYGELDEVVASFEQVYGILDDLEAITYTDADMSQLSDIRTATANYQEAVEAIAENLLEVEELNERRNAAADDVLESAEEISTAGLDTTEERMSDTVLAVGASRAVVLAGLLIALLVAVFVTVLLTRMITTALGRGVSFAEQIAHGDLSAELDVFQKDEIGSLAESLRTMQKRLTNVVADVKAASGNVASGSR